MRRSRRFASITGGTTPCGSTRHPVIHPSRPCTQILRFWPRNRVLAQIGPTPTAHRLFRNRRPGLSPRQSMLLLRKWAVAVPERGLVAKNARFPRTFHPQTPYASHRCAGRSTQRERSTQHARRRASLRLHDTQPPYPTARTFLPATSALPSHLVPLALAFESGLRNIIIGADGQTSASPCLPNARPSSLFRSPRIRDAA